MQTASEPSISSNALRLNGPPPGPTSQRPSPSELPARPQVVRPTPRSRAEEIEDFESMWDVPIRSW